MVLPESLERRENWPAVHTAGSENRNYSRNHRQTAARLATLIAGHHATFAARLATHMAGFEKVTSGTLGDNGSAVNWPSSGLRLAFVCPRRVSRFPRLPYSHASSETEPLPLCFGQTHADSQMRAKSGRPPDERLTLLSQFPPVERFRHSPLGKLTVVPFRSEPQHSILRICASFCSSSRSRFWACKPTFVPRRRPGWSQPTTFWSLIAVSAASPAGNVPSPLAHSGPSETFISEITPQRFHPISSKMKTVNWPF